MIREVMLGSQEVAHALLELLLKLQLEVPLLQKSASSTASRKSLPSKFSMYC